MEEDCWTGLHQRCCSLSSKLCSGPPDLRASFGPRARFLSDSGTFWDPPGSGVDVRSDECRLEKVSVLLSYLCEGKRLFGRVPCQPPVLTLGRQRRR